jgi:predicted nucleic-acid-binding protein
VPVTVALVLEWVLRSSLGCGKDDVLLTLSSLFSADEMTFESERTLEVALQLFRRGSVGLADCLHVALATQAGERPLWSFDKGAAKLGGSTPGRSVSRRRISAEVRPIGNCLFLKGKAFCIL